MSSGAAPAAAASRVGSSGSAEQAPRGWSALSAVMFIPSAVCGCLAYWQYERMRWKEDLIATRRGIATAEPRDVFSLDEPTEYDKVSARGRYLHEYSLYVGPRPRSVPGAGIMQGYLVITPLVSANRKGVVLVNRGWVPAAWKAEAQDAAAATIREREAAESAAKEAAASKQAAGSGAGSSSSQGRGWFGWGKRAPAKEEARPAAPAAVAEPQVVVGVIQADEQPNQFMPSNRPDSDEFHYIQREAMARALGLPADTPLIMSISTDPTTAAALHKRSPLEESRAPPAEAPKFPIAKNVGDLVKFTTMPLDHRNYALVWASLCVALGLMGRHAVTKPLRGPRMVDTSAQQAWKATQEGS